MRLYHYTSKSALRGILSQGEILMTACPYVPGPPAPLVWLTDEDGSRRGGDTLSHALALSAPRGVVEDRIAVRFTLDVPDVVASPWSDYAERYGVSTADRARLLKWPTNSALWWACESQVPSDWWVEIGVGRDSWEPMLAPDPEVEVEGEPEVEGSSWWRRLLGRS